MRAFATFSAMVLLLCLPGIAWADGLISQLPADGAWAKFEIEGTGTNAEGKVTTTVKGTQILRSVGRKMMDNQQCRWIELETDLSFETTMGLKGSLKGKLKEIFKLLIPEADLVQGKNPCEHVLKAYRGRSADMLKELDLKAAGGQAIQSMDEFFHAPLKQITKLPVKTIETKNDKWKCEGFHGESKSESVVFTTETRTNPQVPFGVVTYSYEKDRRKNNESQGGAA